MTQQIINTGTADKGNGDPIRTAFTKVNANFTELYNHVSAGVVADDTAPSAPGEGDLWWDTVSGRLYVYYGNSWVDASPVDGVGASVDLSAVAQNIVPSANITYDLGSPTRRWRDIYLSGNTIDLGGTLISSDGTGGLSVPGGITSDGTLEFADGLTIVDGVIGKSSTNVISEETLSGTISETTTIESQIEIETTGIVIAKRIRLTVNDTVTTSVDEAGSTLTVNDAGAVLKHYTEPDGPNNSAYFQIGTSNAGAVIEGVEENVGSNIYGRVTAAQGVVHIATGVDSIDNDWVFDVDGILTLPYNNYLETIDTNLQIGSQGVVTIRSDAASSTTTKAWAFDKSGTINTPLMLPLTFTAVLDNEHMSVGTPISGDVWEYAVEFQVSPDGEVVSIIDGNVAWPTNPGYADGDEFEFAEADHGIPGFTFVLTLTSIADLGPIGFGGNIAVSEPPNYPSTVKSLDNIKLTADTNSWVFGTDGNITLPDGAKIKSTSSLTGQLEIEVPGGMTEAQSWRFTGEEGIGALYFPDGGRYIASTLYSAVDSDLDFIVNYRPRISHQCYIGTEGEFVADIEFNDDIIAAGVGWTVEVDGTTYTVESVVEGAPANQFRLIVPGATFVSTETYTFINPDAVSKSWTINSQNGTLIASGGAILSSESSPLGGGGTYRDFSIELPTPDGLNEQRWVFANDGDFTAPGDIFAGSFLGQSLEITDAGIVASTYAGDLQTLHVAGAVGKGLTLGVDGGLVSWLFKPNGTLTLPQYHMIESVGSNATITLNALGTNESSIYISTNLDGETIGSSFEIHPNGFGLNSVRDVDIHAGYDYATFKYDAWVDAEQAWTDIRDQDAATIAPETRSWAGLPSYEAYDILMAYLQDPPLGDTPPPSGMAPVANTAKAAYELWQAEQAAINVTVSATDKTWTFGSDGNLTVAGAIRRDEYLYLNSNGTTDKTATVALNGEVGRVFIRTIDGLDQNEWYFKEDGTMQFPDFTSYTGKDITVPLDDSLTVNLSFDAGSYNTNTTFKVNPGSIKLPTGNGYIYSNGDTDASLWGLDSANKTLFFPDAGDGVYPQIRYSTAGDDGMQLFTAAKPIKITTASNTHWTFGTTGDITLPAGGDIVDSNGDSVLGGSGGSVVGITSSSTTTYAVADGDWSWGDWNGVPSREFNGFSNSALFFAGLNSVQPGSTVVISGAYGTHTYTIDSVDTDPYSTGNNPATGYFQVRITTDQAVGSVNTFTFDIVNIELAGNTTIEDSLIINNNIRLKAGADIKNSAGVSVLVSREPSFDIVTSDFSAVAGHRYGINTTNGAIIAYLPQSPVAGDAIFFVDSHGTFATNNFTINGNEGAPFAKTIMGQATQVSSTNNENIGLFYNGTEWRFYA